MQAPQKATNATIAAQAESAKNLPPFRQRDFENAARGFIATSAQHITAANGRLIWPLDKYSFNENRGTTSDTINPSLWIHTQLFRMHGLFRVTDSIHQVRGFDISNITFIQGKSGIIVVDPLISAECAKAALDIYYTHVGRRPVRAVIYTHSHVDHYGGVCGVVNRADVAAGKVRILAPDTFMEHAVSENLLAGVAMRRRGVYMYGTQLPINDKGNLHQIVSQGTVDLVPPTEYVTQSPQAIDIDGVKFVFQLTPETEAPSEMNFYLPELRALCIAEIVSNMMHNLLTPRGALVRDAKRWAFYINEAIEWFGDNCEVLFQSHCWPRWGSAEIGEFMRKQRDLYAYMHDQTMRMINQGYTPIDIAETLRLPPSLACESHCRDYYGSLNFNAKAIYQRYIGWFDGNPANLNPLPPVEAGKQYLEFMGGANELLKKAKACYDKGDYRWVVQVINHLVFADPNNMEARFLQANALEQLGYQTECGTWRRFYLSGAQELRGALPPLPNNLLSMTRQLLVLPLPLLFDQFAIRLNGERAAGHNITIVFIFKQDQPKGEPYYVYIENAVLHHRPSKNDDKADTKVTTPKLGLLQLMAQQTDLTTMLSAGEVTLDGSRDAFNQFLQLFDRFNHAYSICLPQNAKL